MIFSYRGKRTKDFVSEKRVKALFGFERSAENKLAQLDSTPAKYSRTTLKRST